MSNRDAQQTKRAAILSAPVLIFAVVAAVAVALEAFDSPNTMAILAVLGAPILGTQILQLAQGQKTDAKLDRLGAAVNGELDGRIRAAVTAVLVEREQDSDERVRAIVIEELANRSVSCTVRRDA